MLCIEKKYEQISFGKGILPNQEKLFGFSNHQVTTYILCCWQSATHAGTLLMALHMCISSSYLAQMLRAQWPWKPHLKRKNTWIRKTVSVHHPHFMYNKHITTMLSWCEPLQLLHTISPDFAGAARCAAVPRGRYATEGKLTCSFFSGFTTNWGTKLAEI